MPGNIALFIVGFPQSDGLCQRSCLLGGRSGDRGRNNLTQVLGQCPGGWLCRGYSTMTSSFSPLLMNFFFLPVSKPGFLYDSQPWSECCLGPTRFACCYNNHKHNPKAPPPTLGTQARHPCPTPTSLAELLNQRKSLRGWQGGRALLVLFSRLY